MRLTNTMKEAFVRAAMLDVPAIDYKEQARSLINKKMAELQKAAGLSKINPERLDSTTGYARSKTDKYALSFRAIGLTYSEIEQIGKAPEVRQLLDLHEEQEQTLSELRGKLTGAINACNTRKQAAEALPEFEKYLPDDEPKALRSLPALANVAADFVKAGWPKTASNSSKKLQAA